MDFEPVKGFVTDHPADAIVNSASTTLEMRRGIGGTLRRAARGPINEEAVAKGPVRLGEVVVTQAYELDAEYVIHAVVIPDYGQGKASADSIKLGTRNSLHKADNLGCESLLIPVLGCGIVGFNREEGINIIGNEIYSFVPESLQTVYFNGYSDDDMRWIRTVRSSLIGGGH